MSLVTEFLLQTAVYWAPGKRDAHGQPTFATPVEIACRWEDEMEQIVKADGSLTVSASKVFVDADLKVGGMMLLASLASLADPSDPNAFEDATTIMNFGKTPAFEADDFVRIAWLGKSGGS